MSDTQLFYTLHSVVGQSATLDRVIVFFASDFAYLILVLFIGLLILSSYAHREKVLLLVTALLAVGVARGVITEGIRFFYHRPRPFTELGIEPLFTDPAWSFPSGHATFFFALATVVYLYNRHWGVWFFAGALAITLGRVVAGVHFPSDILGGAIIGLLTGYLSYLLVRRLTRRADHQTY